MIEKYAVGVAAAHVPLLRSRCVVAYTCLRCGSWRARGYRCRCGRYLRSRHPECGERPGWTHEGVWP